MRLTNDHRPDRKDEQRRIKEAGALRVRARARARARARVRVRFGVRVRTSSGGSRKPAGAASLEPEP